MDEMFKKGFSSILYILDEKNKSGITENYLNAKIANIESFLGIDKSGLESGVLEKRLLMYSSLCNEMVYLEFPGKESKQDYVNQGGINLNPNDFRPELHIDEKISAKLSLVDIALCLLEYSRICTGEQLMVIAAMLIKIAYMDEYKYISLMHPSRLLRYFENGKRFEVCAERRVDEISRYYLSFSKAEKELLAQFPKIKVPSRKYNEWIEVSIEGFLYYLDILAQQEDCKYFYRKALIEKTEYPVGIGRINNLLTIIKVIDKIQTNEPYCGIISRMGRSVDPVKVNKFEAITGGLIMVEKTNGVLFNIRRDD